MGAKPKDGQKKDKLTDAEKKKIKQQNKAQTGILGSLPEISENDQFWKLNELKKSVLFEK